ncbi:hypothetical protein TcasGA2_TC033347 [Tribolium castaneum]|uniref:Pacifastin domain-containing protein n=1 Tax=Tribolium castaneum TaxID=7070 RepID=A0A139WDC5_TRICA|nr:hypothetical protein TcasGA2_TC033347 [Tribolium castaneum]
MATEEEGCGRNGTQWRVGCNTCTCHANGFTSSCEMIVNCTTKY